MIDETGTAVRWSNQTFPLQIAIMDAIDDPLWSKVAVIGPAQAGGKTDCGAINPILRAVHHLRQDAVYMSANASKAYDQWRKKFNPAIEACPDVKRLIPEDRNLIGDKTRHDFVNGTSVFVVGAESMANISGSTIPFVVCDDVQAMPMSVGTLGHPVDAVAKRSASLPEDQRTLVMLGTAGTKDDYLWTTITASTHFQPYLACPGCGHYQVLLWSRMHFDQGDEIKASRDYFMACENGCDYQIRDADLPVMLRTLRWVARGQKVNDKGEITGEMPSTKIAGFWWNALYWPFTSWGLYTAQWVQSRGHPDMEKDFQQHVLVIPWEPAEEDVDVLETGDIAKHASKQHRYRTIPKDADLVSMTVDVHARFLYYTVRAWSKQNGTSWLVDAGTIGVSSPMVDQEMPDRERQQAVGLAIRDALERVWMMDIEGWPRIGSDERVQSTLVLIDGGYRPDAVGKFCHERDAGLPTRKWRMIVGRSRPNQALPIWPKSSKRSRYGIFTEVGVDEAKHVLRELLAVPRGKKGAWVIYGDRPLKAYSKHMIAEHFVTKVRGGRETKVWEKRPGAGANHWWDCEVYQVAAAMCLGIRLSGVYVEKIEDAPVTDWFKRQRENRRGR